MEKINTSALQVIRPFLSRAQLVAMVGAAQGEEGAFFLQKFVDLARQIDGMPVTYAQDGMGNRATAYLHYFIGGCDWYITEKDKDGGVRQAYGYAVLNGDDEMAECGYISIEELVGYGAELDLYFAPRTLAAIKAERAGETEAVSLNKWVIVINPGTDEQDIWADFSSYLDALSRLKTLRDAGEHADIMKRLEDGLLTTEF